MRNRIAAAALVLAASIGGMGVFTAGIAADDACGHCFRVSVWYWEHRADMSGTEIYEWLGKCLKVNRCLAA